MSAAPAQSVAPAAETAGDRAPYAPVADGHRYRRPVIAAAVMLVLVVAGATAWWLSQRTAPVQYSTAPVSRGPIVRAVTATGTVNPVLTIMVGSYVSGVIQALYCDYNTRVKNGQVCAKIDPRPYQSLVDQNAAALAVARAQLAKDEASLEYAKVNYEREALLVRQDSTALATADSARSLYQQAQAQVGYDRAAIQQRQAELGAAQVNLAYTNIRSPVDGTVVSRNVTMGQTVAASFQTPTLFLIATDLTKMQVDTNISESDIGGIRDGNGASFTVDAYPNRVFTGAVTQVRQSPQTVQNVVTFDVVVSVDNSDLALKPGMTAATQVVIEQRGDVMRVPAQALRYMPGTVAPSAAASAGTRPAAALPPGSRGANQGQVWVLRDKQPVAVPVIVGLSDDRVTEIVEGALRPGDPVIIGEQRQAAAAAAKTPAPRF